MNLENDPRILELRDALQDEVHGLWISFEMAVKVLARLDKVTAAASAGASSKPVASAALT